MTRIHMNEDDAYTNGMQTLSDIADEVTQFVGEGYFQLDGCSHTFLTEEELCEDVNSRPWGEEGEEEIIAFYLEAKAKGENSFSAGME